MRDEMLVALSEAQHGQGPLVGGILDPGGKDFERGRDRGARRAHGTTSAMPL